jgi:hypothetical protein
LVDRHRPLPNKRKVVRPSSENLKKMLWEIPTTSIAKQYGVSDNAVAKWAKSYKLNKPPRGYWQKLKCGVLGVGTELCL